MKKGSPETLRLNPLTGSFDVRSMPEHVSPQTWRLLQNTRAIERGRLCRFPGWQKFLSGYATTRDYNNEDLHDQLLSLQTYYDNRDDIDDSEVLSYPPDNASFADYCGTVLNLRQQGRQPVTFLAEITSTLNTRIVLAGTQSRLYQLDQGKGNWRILTDGFGGVTNNPQIRFKHAVLADFVFLTNNYDEPCYWMIGGTAEGCAMRSTRNIEDLRTIGVSKVGCCAVFKGCMFIANLEEDGRRKGNMVRWSDYLAPTSWVEDPGFSQAGHLELDYGEDVLAMEQSGDFLIIHTTRGIWQVSVSPEQFVIFSFHKVFASSTGEACIAYQHTFVTIGEAHFYMAKDGIYVWSAYSPRPERLEWIHQSSEILYGSLNKSQCAIHTAGYDPFTQELYFSCAAGSALLPTQTLVCSTRYQQCSLIDHGFSAFMASVPDDRPSLRDWMIDNCICSEETMETTEMLQIGFRTVKEGDGKPRTNPPCTEFPTAIHTDAVHVEGDIITEDWDAAVAPYSLCAMFPDLTVADICENCEGDPAFVAASTADYCLKQIGGVYHREQHVSGDTYELDGYDTIMLKGPMLFGTESRKQLLGIALEFDAAVQATPSEMTLRVGASRRAEDPLDSCGISWYQEDGRPIACVDDDRRMEWAVFAEEVALYIEFKISGTGGASCYSSLEVEVGKGGCA